MKKQNIALFALIIFFFSSCKDSGHETESVPEIPDVSFVEDSENKTERDSLNNEIGAVLSEDNYMSQPENVINADEQNFISEGSEGAKSSMIDFQSANESLIRQEQEKLQNEISQNSSYTEKPSALKKKSLDSKTEKSRTPKRNFYFVYDHFPEEARKPKIMGNIDFSDRSSLPDGDGIMPYKAREHKLRPKTLARMSANIPNSMAGSSPVQKNRNRSKVCQVCILESFRRGRGFINFISHSYMIMHLKPGCPIPKGFVGAWEGAVTPPHVLYEYDCDKPVPVPKDLCTGWLVNYYCD